MPTIACHMQLLRPGETTQARRRVCRTNYHVVEGAGYSMVGAQRLDWEDTDVFTVPTWNFCEHVNSGDRPAFLFSFCDAPVMKALSLHREETKHRNPILEPLSISSARRMFSLVRSAQIPSQRRHGRSVRAVVSPPLPVAVVNGRSRAKGPKDNYYFSRPIGGVHHRRDILNRIVRLGQQLRVGHEAVHLAQMSLTMVVMPTSRSRAA
jgi:hypothetical protein